MLYPTLDITINGKNRVKKSNEALSKVYLSDNDEFGIEMFNPTQEVLLAKIKMNGKFISTTGLIVMPGERVFLDRYIDTADKFKFSTYKVEAGNTEVEKAVESNGLVEVYWYKERENCPYTLSISNDSIVNLPRIWYNASNPVNTCSSSTLTNQLFSQIGAAETTMNSNCASGTVHNSTYTTSGHIKYSNKIDNSACNSYEYCYTNTSFNKDGNIVSSNDVKEYVNGNCVKNDHKTFYDTGRVEKGSKSDQKLVSNDNYIFDTVYSYVNAIQIIPNTQRPIYVSNNDLSNRKIYCTNCGKKLHKKYKFCPNCGNKI